MHGVFFKNYVHNTLKYNKLYLKFPLDKGPYIKYVGGGGGQRVFVKAMKYLRHILMGHEIFFKIFDGPRNIFLCCIFKILFLS